MSSPSRDNHEVATKDISEFKNPQEAYNYISVTTGRVNINWIIVNEHLLAALTAKNYKKSNLTPNGIYISDERKLEILQALGIEREKDIEDFINEIEYQYLMIGEYAGKAENIKIYSIHKDYRNMLDTLRNKLESYKNKHPKVLDILQKIQKYRESLNNSYLDENNKPESYDQWKIYIDNIRDFIEELKNTEVISEEQDKKHDIYALQIQQYFPKTIWLPNMIGTNYFVGLTEQEYAHIDNDIVNLAEELTAIYTTKKLTSQDDNNNLGNTIAQA